MKNPIIMAHRGASGYAPENTMAAFKKALQLGATGIELDVHLTRDDHVVVIHDDKVNRTSNGKGLVREMTLEQLRSLDFGSWYSSRFKGEKIPLLEDIFKLLANESTCLNVEIKGNYEGIEKKVINLAEKYNMLPRLILSSFNHNSLIKAKRISKDIKTGIISYSKMIPSWQYAKKLDAYAIHPYYGDVNENNIKTYRDNGIKVNVYTVNEDNALKEMVTLGVDGIITNVPDKALKIIKG